MTPEHTEQLEYILGHVSVGVAVLDAHDFHICYANSYLCSLLNEPWCTRQDVAGRHLEEVVPDAVRKLAQPLLHYVASTGKRVNYTEVPYEGFLETRGRTYWRITIERSTLTVNGTATECAEKTQLIIYVEDVTDAVRSRLHLNAIHHISTAIAGGAALSQVLDRILQALQDMVGSKRCAVLLVDQPQTENEQRGSFEEADPSGECLRVARIAAHKGLHPRSYGWTPCVNEHVLLGRVEESRQTLIITDTSSEPDIELPTLIKHGKAYRPGSVLCVPIFEARATTKTSPLTREEEEQPQALLGTIEVYHRRARGFSAEEVALLEQFAQQAGLAIQTARLFRSIDRLARTASRNAHQKENVMQAIPDGVVIFDPRWRIADANQAARNLFGWPESIIGTPIGQAFALSKAHLPAEILHTSDLVEVMERRALEGTVDEMKIESSDGQNYTLRCSYTPIRDDLGDIFAFIVIYHDITEAAEDRERIEAEVVARTQELAQRNEALQEAKAALEMVNARMSVMLERLPSGVLLVSAEDQSIIMINRRACEITQSLGSPLIALDDTDEDTWQVTGYNSNLLLRAIDLYGPSGTLVPYEEQPLMRALTRGEASEAELHAGKQDGNTIYLLVNAAPLRAPDGSISSAILVLHEISRVKALERAREDFFTTMAHELKTPLANIRAHLSALLAQDMEWSMEEQYRFLQTADEQVERLVRMVNQCLDASRVEAGALRLEMEPIIIPELLEDLEDRLEALIITSARRLDISLPEQLPAVQGDYELIMSVLTNLLSNAFRYAPEGDGVQLDIEPVCDELDKVNAVTFRVTDRGPGLTLEQQQELFTRFSTFAALNRPAMDRPGQPALEKRRGGGRWSPATGLGLYISRGIVEAHGDTLTVKSSPGQGASFAFTLPVFSGRRARSARPTPGDQD